MPGLETVLEKNLLTQIWSPRSLRSSLACEIILGELVLVELGDVGVSYDQSIAVRDDEELLYLCVYVCLVTKSCQILCDSTDCSPPGSSVLGILQARILDWVAMLFSRGSAWPRDRTRVSYSAGGFFTTEPPGNISVFVPRCSVDNFLFVSSTLK